MGTPGYVAPEIIEYQEKSKMYGLSCDVFSIGVIIYEMQEQKKLNSFCYTHPFKSKTKDETVRQNVHAQINFDDRVCIPQSLKSLIISMVKKNPRQRFTLQQCLEHDLFKESLSKFNEQQQEIQEHEPKTIEIRNIRCKTLQLLTTQNNKRRQSLPQDFSVTQEPQIQQNKIQMIISKEKVLILITDNLYPQYMSQIEARITAIVLTILILLITIFLALKQPQMDMLMEIFLIDSRNISKEFGNTYFIKQYLRQKYISYVNLLSNFFNKQLEIEKIFFKYQYRIFKQ